MSFCPEHHNYHQHKIFRLFNGVVYNVWVDDLNASKSNTSTIFHCFASPLTSNHITGVYCAFLSYLTFIRWFLSFIFSLGQSLPRQKIKKPHKKQKSFFSFSFSHFIPIGYFDKILFELKWTQNLLLFMPKIFIQIEIIIILFSHCNCLNFMILNHFSVLLFIFYSILPIFIHPH